MKMEMPRTQPPDPGFLEGGRELCNRHNIVLIFDEYTSGFRETFGGLHLQYGAEPDTAIFGKALGGGYVITATLGRRAFMEAAQKSFISSTFWTERIGPTATLKSLDVMEREQSWEQVTAISVELLRQCQAMADCRGLTISHNDLPALTGVAIQSVKGLKYKTLITQEMLKRGSMAGMSCYISPAHTPDVIDPYLDHLNTTLALIPSCEASRSVDELQGGLVCHSSFLRLN